MTDSATLIAAVLEDVVLLAHEFLLGEEDDIEPDDDLLDAGFDSISLALLLDRANRKFSIELDPLAVFDRPSLLGIAQVAVETHPEQIGRLYAGRVDG